MGSKVKKYHMLVVIDPVVTKTRLQNVMAVMQFAATFPQKMWFHIN